MSVKKETGSLKVTFKECGRTFLVKREEGNGCEGCVGDKPGSGVNCIHLPLCYSPTSFIFLKEIVND